MTTMAWRYIDTDGLVHDDDTRYRLTVANGGALTVTRA